MKKRLAAMVLALAMLFSLSPAAVAEDSVYFTAVDERVLDLNDSTMPFWFGGYLYVAATVFRESGVGYSYNIVSQTLVLYDSSRSLVFDIATGAGTDGQGNLYDHVCVTRGGVTFVAASPVASFFGRTYSNTRVNHGYLIRVKSSSAVLPDSMFTETATYQLDTKYQQYQKKNFAEQTPDREPEESGDPELPDDPTSGKSIYLCFLAEDAASGRLAGYTGKLRRAGRVLFHGGSSLPLRRSAAAAGGVRQRHRLGAHRWERTRSRAA